jgi:DNA-binding NtrC family response regulator
VFHEEKRILMLNLAATISESLSDFLDLWEYDFVRVDNQDCQQYHWPDGPFSLIIFQFNDFSDKEYQLLESVKSDAGAIPIVVTSSFISVKDCFRMAKIGITEYFGQPFLPLELKKLVEKYTEAQSLATT